MGFPGGSVVKTLSANAEDSRDAGSISGSGGSPGGGNGNPLVYSWLGNCLMGYSPGGCTTHACTQTMLLHLLVKK